jgi:hypothetical protein
MLASIMSYRHCDKEVQHGQQQSVRTVSDAAHAGRRVPLRRGVETTEATDSP